MQENKLSEQLDDYENLISEFKSKMATLRQHEDELNQKKTILEAKEQELNFREIESNQNCNEENEQMLDRIKIKLDKINQKEKELELKLNSEPSLKHESNHKITEIEHSKKLLEGQILQFKAQNEAYILEIESLRAANNSLNEELKSKS
jgi:chromosome segregation ATPase